jgi:hypothetical protein
MFNIKHEPTKDFYNNYIIESSCIDEVIFEMIPRIRKQSQEFYKKNIREELEKKNDTIIDRHAGNGIFYTIKKVKKSIANC